MRISLIRHGMTEANERRLYCGFTDLPLSEQGRMNLAILKNSVSYPSADVYISSGLSRATETMQILYGQEPDAVIEEFMEMNFGEFEMHSYEELKHKLEYQNWINDLDNTEGSFNVACPSGESRSVFQKRVTAGLSKLLGMRVDSVAVISHGGVIVTVMERLFPGQKNFYEWQPGYGRGYTIDILQEKVVFISYI